MIYRGWIHLLLGALAWAQTVTPGSQAKPQKAPPPSAAVTTPAPQNPSADPSLNLRPDTPVITIEGLCDNPPPDPPAAATCKTVVTREEFDQIVSIFAPNLPPSGRRQFATQYATVLRMAHEAHRRGLDQGPRFEEVVKTQRLAALQRELTSKLQEEAGQVPEKDVEYYYRKNEVMYQETDLERLFVPRRKQLDPPKAKLTDEDAKKRQQDADDEMKKEAQSLRARAVAGEDLDKLQEEAYTAAGLKTKPPNTKMGKVRRTSLTGDQVLVMDLKTSEVSQAFVTPTEYVVYKVEGKDVLSLEKVRQEIVNTLRQQRLDDSLKSIQQSGTPVLNDVYFGEPPAAAASSVPSQPGSKPEANPSTPTSK